jgi:hypothetical protein
MAGRRVNPLLYSNVMYQDFAVLDSAQPFGHLSRSDVQRIDETD